MFFSSRRRHTRYWRDWSSDVCSSDLISIGRTGVARMPSYSLTNFILPKKLNVVSDSAPVIAAAASIEIGRASCRERVQISVVDVSLKKTKKHHFTVKLQYFAVQTDFP